MKIGVSYLSIKDNFKEKVKLIDETDAEYIHVDVMDGEFVENITRPYEEVLDALNDTIHPKDVHLMVTRNNLKEYIDNYAKLSPEYITFHLEIIDNDYTELVDYIHSKGIKVGIAINPNTSINSLNQYDLSKIDLILVMSVYPGKGGQSFILESEDRINSLASCRKEKGYNFIIEVDGGINDATIDHITNVDLAVVGSYITNSDDYQKQINSLR